jgi:hypothetical protein
MTDPITGPTTGGRHQPESQPSAPPPRFARAGKEAQPCHLERWTRSAAARSRTSRRIAASAR